MISTWKLEKHVFLEKFGETCIFGEICKGSPPNMLWKTKTNYETFEIIV
jgi:hypothetical protein